MRSSSQALSWHITAMMAAMPTHPQEMGTTIIPYGFETESLSPLPEATWWSVGKISKLPCVGRYKSAS